MLVTFWARALKFLCLAMTVWLFSFSANAQCTTQSSVTIFYPNLTRIQCSGTDYFVDGYIDASNYFKPPFSNVSIGASAGSSASVSIAGDSILYRNLVLNGSTSPNADTRIILKDSCGNTDTMLITFYAPAAQLPLINATGNYSLCDSSFRVGVTAAGLTSVVFTSYNFNTNNYDTLTPSAVNITSDSIIVTGLPPGYYQVHYKDSCGNKHIASLDGSLNNYSYFAYGGRSICDSTGLSISFKPNLYGPFTYLSYTATGTGVPVVNVTADSILISNATPFNNYAFSFLDGCGDTFFINYYAIDTSKAAFTPVLNTKNCTSYSLYVKTTGGPFYDVQMESGLVAPGLGYVYYPDSLVITGLPVDSSYNQFVISFRDSSCHNRRYISYYLAQEQFSSGASPNWNRIDTCGTGFALRTNRLAGISPFTGFTWLKGPNTPNITISGDTLKLTNGIQLLNQQVDTLYRFAMTDACGKADTFNIPSYQFNGTTNIITQLIYSIGGCQGAGNGSAKVRFQGNTQYPSPYSNLTVSGPSGASFSFAGDTLTLTGLVPDSNYTIRFQDTCGHIFQYLHTTPSSNIPMLIDVTPSAEGVCLKMLDSNFSLNVTVANPNYPYSAYLSGPVADTIMNMSLPQFAFANLPIGTYQIKVVDMCNNIQTLAYTIVSPGTLTTINYAAFDKFKGCDSFVYNYSKYLNLPAMPSGFINNLKFKGPYTAYVVRGTDTFWSYNNNTADTTSISIPFTFPALGHVSPLETMYVIDGCQDTAAVYVYPLFHYFGYTNYCDSGIYTNEYASVSFNSYLNYNYPIRLTYLNGNLQDTSALVFYDGTQSQVLKFKVGESACYRITDSCNIDLGQVCFSGPPEMIYYYDTRICGYPTDGPHKGNVRMYNYYNNGNDSIRYHLLSGPGTIPDTTALGGGLLLTNIDTGTYVMVATEANTCARTDTFTFRVEPFLDSISIIVVPGCLNANKVVFYYYDNSYSSDYYDLTLNPYKRFSLNNMNYSYNSYNIIPGDTQYNLNSNMEFYLHDNYCGADSFRSPAYENPSITASAGFRCGVLNSIAIMGTKGVPPYTYEVLSGSPVNYSAPPQSSNVLTGMLGASGNAYQVRIADQCGNAFTSLVYANAVVNPVTEIGTKCINNNYTAKVDSIPHISYTWKGPNSFTHVGTSINFSPVTTADTGLYKLYIRNSDVSCATDTIYNVRVSSCIPLPIDDLELYARWQDDHQALVSWSHAAGSMVNNYLIQRSEDGVSFATLSSIDADKNSQGSRTYYYTDNQLLSRNFYRIKVQEQNGQQWFSPVVELSRNSQSGMLAMITRNGTEGKSRLRITNCPSGTMDLAVYNMQGTQVHHTSINAVNNPVALYDLPTGLVPGLYMVKIRIAGQTVGLKWSLVE